MTCPTGTVCSGGTCWPKDGPLPCGAGEAFVRGACRELVCEGVQCNVGEACEGGSCVTGGGVYPAGNIWPQGDSAQAQGVVARFNGTSWERINQSPLPPLQELQISQDGTSLFAVTNNGGLWVSHDGVTWVQRWQGDTSTTGYFYSDPVKMAPRPAGCLQRGETGVLCCQ